MGLNCFPVFPVEAECLQEKKMLLVSPFTGGFSICCIPLFEHLVTYLIADGLHRLVVLESPPVGLLWLLFLFEGVLEFEPALLVELTKLLFQSVDKKRVQVRYLYGLFWLG